MRFSSKRTKYFVDIDVASWREGGSRKQVQPEEEERSTPTPPPPHSNSAANLSSEDEDSSQAYRPPPVSHPLPSQNAMPCMIRPGVSPRMGPSPGPMMFGHRMPPFVRSYKFSAGIYY